MVSTCKADEPAGCTEGGGRVQCVFPHPCRRASEPERLAPRGI